MSFYIKNVFTIKSLLQLNKCLNNKSVVKYLSTNESIISYEVIEPFEWINKKRFIGSDIEKPDYAQDSTLASQRVPKYYNLIKSNEQIKGIANSCKIAKNVLTRVGNELKIGISGEDIDDMVFDLCQSYRCYPSPLNYKGFPKCVTTSVNNVAVHGIPDKRRLINGDIITVDVSIYFKGFHGDCAHTFIIGESDPNAKLLAKVAELCLYKAIDVCKDGQKLSEIGKTVETIANEYGFSVIQAFCGHGIGHNLHEPPNVLHYEHKSDEIMRENMTITIEPVISEGTADVTIDETDGWTVFTEDNSRTAQFEHTICITKDKAIILTQI